MKSVAPDSGKVGTVVRVHGISLGRDKVDELYLSDHTLDMMVKVLAQSDDVIEFRIPPSVKPGKLQLVIKTAGKQAYLLEQPLYVTVEEPKETGEVAALRSRQGSVGQDWSLTLLGRMFSLLFRPPPDQEDLLIAELWECGTTGIVEEEGGIRAFFDDLSQVHRFASQNPEVREEKPVDWAQATRDAWPPIAGRGSGSF